MKIFSLLLGFFVIITVLEIDNSFGMESKIFDLPSNSIQTFEIPLNEGDVVDYTLFITGEDENQIGFRIISPMGQKDFGNINEKFNSSLIAEFSGDYNFEFDNSFSDASNKQIEFEFTITKNIFHVYVDEIPRWSENTSSSINSAMDFWKFKNPQLVFYFVDSPQQADFSIQFVKEFGTEHVGYAANGSFIEVGFGDSKCRETWQPYSEKYVSQIIAHEIGHVIGLEHVDDPENIMYPIGSTSEYGLTEEDFVVTSGYGQFIPMCTVKDLSAFRFTVDTDDPKHGIDVYTVPSLESFDNWSKGNSFFHYTHEKCNSSGMLRFSGACDGLTIGSGLLILTDKEQTNSLTTVTVKMQEIPSNMDSPQKIGMIFVNSSENSSVQKYFQTSESNSITVCGKSTVEKNGQCVPEFNNKSSSSGGGGCLIATAVYGTELAPQVQFLREIRDNTVMSTSSGTAFMAGFNQVYYSFSPYIADMERENPMFKEAVSAFITPMISTLSIMTLADDGSEIEVLGLGISVIALNLGMYIAAPAVVGFAVSKRIRSNN